MAKSAMSDDRATPKLEAAEILNIMQLYKNYRNFGAVAQCTKYDVPTVRKCVEQQQRKLAILAGIPIAIIISCVVWICFMQASYPKINTPTSKSDPFSTVCKICGREYRGSGSNDDMYQGMCKSCWADFVKHEFSD